jgi:hypothetical protein
MIRRESVKSDDIPEVTDGEWVTFPGGELEGARPRVRCPDCRRRAARAPACSTPEPICFQCYRVDQARQRALRAARNLNTASEERFQTTLPFEPVNRARLERLRAERSTARATMKIGSGRYVDKRRHAQIAARHALDRIAAGLRSRGAHNPSFSDANHAAELQLPEAWIPFVVSR